MDTFRVLARVDPKLIRRWYEFFSRLDRSAALTVMNYGFEDGQRPPLTVAEEGDRYRLQLYDHLARKTELAGKQVLEVGSGRGGGAAYLARAFQPEHLWGVDFSPRAVAFSRGRYQDPRLSFVAADAQELPFRGAAFDAAFNVESSHCYPDLAGFLAEVARVLRPGGWFLYADFRPRTEVAAWQAQLHAQPELVVESKQVITPNVVASLKKDSRAKALLLRRHFPKPLWPLLAVFAAVEGSPVYRAFRAGRKEYWSFVLRRA